MMKWKLAFASIGITLYAAYLWDDYKEPSDSGQMTWFTYLMVDYKAKQGDGEALERVMNFPQAIWRR